MLPLLKPVYTFGETGSEQERSFGCRLPGWGPRRTGLPRKCQDCCWFLNSFRKANTYLTEMKNQATAVGGFFPYIKQVFN